MQPQVLDIMRMLQTNLQSCIKSKISNLANSEVELEDLDQLKIEDLQGQDIIILNQKRKVSMAIILHFILQMIDFNKRLKISYLPLINTRLNKLWKTN